MRELQQILFKNKNASSLSFFRFAFGCILTWEVCRYFYYGWIKTYWIDPDFFFTYDFFQWLSPLADNLMYVHFFALGVLAIFIALGLFYRLSIILFFLGFTYIFLLDKTNYLNHFYLISLLSFILIWLPANSKYSIDAKIFKGVASETVPYWAILAIQLQIGVAYFFGGIAKLNTDWLNGEPMRDWLLDVKGGPLLGQLLAHPYAAWFFSYGGLLLDLFVVPLLLWKKTRIPAFITICIFHLFNAKLFSIGIFPWFMIAATTIYFNPSWVKNLLYRFKIYDFSGSSTAPVYIESTKKMFTYGFVIYFAIQFIYPLRHHAIPGNANWTEEGHRYAWHMKLRQKSAKARFRVVNNQTGEVKEINPRKDLSKRQYRKMSTRPDMILQYAHHLSNKHNKEGEKHISVYADVEASLNGREKQLLIKPHIDLSKQHFNIFKNDWIVPLNTPLLLKHHANAEN